MPVIAFVYRSLYGQWTMLPSAATSFLLDPEQFVFRRTNDLKRRADAEWLDENVPGWKVAARSAGKVDKLTRLRIELTFPDAESKELWEQRTGVRQRAEREIAPEIRPIGI